MSIDDGRSNRTGAAGAGAGSEASDTVLRIGVSMRVLAAVLLLGFDALMAWLVVFSLTGLAGGPSIGLAVFVGVVALAMTWVLWRLIATRTIVTPTDVVLKYVFLPTVRIPRASITGVDVRQVSYNATGGGFVYTPSITVAAGRDRLVYMLGRRSQPRALQEAERLRQLVAS